MLEKRNVTISIQMFVIYILLFCVLLIPFALVNYFHSFFKYA